MTTLKGNKKLLIIGIPIAVVLPLLIVTLIIGKAAIWIWLGILLGMIVVSWQMKRRQQRLQKRHQQQVELPQ